MCGGTKVCDAASLDAATALNAAPEATAALP